MPELDAMNPDMPQEQPSGLAIPNGETDHEGAMAKADLYKLANYSFKLFKKLQDDDQLEAWVQAKITKAADYIASVYHYLEYEMKFSEYGHQLDNSDVMSESQRAVLKNKLMEAKAKMKELKKAQAEKVKEGSEHKNKDEFDSRAKEGDTYKTSKGGEVTKTKTGIKHEKKYSDSYKGHGSSKDSDLDESEEKRPATKKTGERDVTLPSGAKVKARTYQGHQSQKADKDAKFDKKGDLEEGKGNKPDFLDMDKDGDKKEPMKKAVADKKKNPFAKKVKESLKGGQKKLDVDKDGDIEADDLADLRAGKKDKKVDEASDEKCNHTAKGKKCPVHGLKECGMYEGKPSAGLSKEKKSAVVKKAKAGGDIGKPGKGFAKVEKAAKKSGAKDPKAVAAAAMWKNVKESVKSSMEEEQLDEFDVKLYQPHEYEFSRGFGASISGSPEVKAILAQMKPSDFPEQQKYDRENPPKPNETPEDRRRNIELSLAAKRRDEYNFVQRYNRDHNNLSIAQWLEKAKNNIKGAVTGKPAEPVSYQSSRGEPGNTSFEKEFPKFESINESTEVDRLKELTKRLLG